MATQAQVLAYTLARNSCLQLGVGQSLFYHRRREGTITQVVGFPNNSMYDDADPRVGPGPTDTAVSVWLAIEPVRVRNISSEGGDDKPMRGWLENLRAQIPAIADDGSVLSVQDEDFIQLPDGFLARIENPTMDSTDSLWQFQLVRQR
jgi:hypothetical protein